MVGGWGEGFMTIKERKFYSGFQGRGQSGVEVPVIVGGEVEALVM